MTPDSSAFDASKKHRPHFHFHGCGHAFSASFTRPFHEHIDALAATALPPTGGHGSSRVEKFQFREFLSFKSAYTHVSGGYQEDDDSNNTLVTSVIEGLNMMDVLTADRIVSRLYSKHPRNAPEGNITMHGSKFENLSICGQPFKINLDFKSFDSIQTFQHATDAFKSTDGKFSKLVRAALRPGQELTDQKCNGAYLCSLVDGDLRLGYHQVDRDHPSHSIYVPGFGKVFFAEVMMSHGTRTLTMLRFELGSTTSVSGSATSATTNGRQYPPGG
jgi:hypothetical protein